MSRSVIIELFHWLDLDFSRGFRAHSVQYILSVLLVLLPKVQSKICGNFFGILLLLVSLYSAVRSLLQMQSGLGSRWNKENCSGSPSKQLQRLRVELSDKTFQLHKLQQDYAQERAHSLAQVQRERVHLLKQLKELKEKNIFDNEEWSNKIGEQRKEHSRELQKLEEKYEKNLGKDRQLVRRTVELEFERRIEELKLALLQLKQSSQEALALERKKRIKELQQSQSKWQNLLQSQKKQNNLIFETMKKQLQQKINVLQRLYLSEEKSKQILAQNMQRHLQESVKEKIILEACLAHEKQKVSQLNSKLSLCEYQIKQLNQQIQKNKIETQIKLKQLETDHSKKIFEIKQQHNQNIKAQKLAFTKETQLLRLQFTRFRELQEQKQKKWQERGEKILNNMSKTGSEKGDDTAKLLETQLKKKQGQLQHQKQALRLCRLQLENMAQVYDKVFLANNYLNRQRGKSYKIQQKAQLCHSGVLQPIRARLRTHGDQ